MIKRIKEHRNRRLIAKSGLFDEKYYLLRYPDIRKADIDPIKHYLKIGAKELRNPSEDFDTKYYLENNPDVEESGINPLVHYLRYGMYENREINKSGKIIKLKKTTHKNKLMIKMSIIQKIAKNIKQEPKLLLNTGKNISQNGVSDTILKINEKLKGEVDISQKDSSKKLGSLNNFFNEVANIPTINLNKPIDIIVPVYNGFEYLESIFKSIISNTTLNYRVLICDDKSLDERVLPFLKDIVSKNKNMELFENEENLGFIKTVNKLVEKTQNHFVILNTDTEVPSFWLERLMYPIFSMENIASTTPFTNAGTICSFPEYLKDNEILDGMSVDDIDSYFKIVDFQKNYIEIPTGVGFCMGINKNLVNEIGFFDEIFGKGYAEENDWCQRAIKKGYKNIHVTNLFVYHKHGGSFTSDVKKTLLEKNLKILNTKHQEYNTQVRKTVQENKLEDLRNILFYKIKSFNTHTTLIFTHDLGGGTKFYTEQEIQRRLIEKENILLIKYNFKEKTYFIEMSNKNKKSSFYNSDENEIFDFLNHFKIDEIFVNSLVSYHGIYKTIEKIINLQKIKKSKVILPIHDFFPVCPDFNLLGKNSIYCNIPKDSSICHKCLSSKKEPIKKINSQVDIKAWREQWQQLLNITDEIRCFSQSSKEIVRTVYPKFADLIIVKPHDIDGKYKNIYNPSLNSKPRVIGILGGIGTAKGSLVVKNMVEHIDKNKLDIKIVVIGNINQHINSPSFTVTGSYKSEELVKLVKEHNITEFFIPSVWPETFSYVTDEIMQMGYPLTVFDLGAPAERVKDYVFGNVISFDKLNVFLRNEI
jgi:GT2 family glycosyltransferase